MKASWRFPAALAALVLAGGAVIAWLQPTSAPQGYLDPGSTGPVGGHALAAILSERGAQVIKTTTAAQAAQQAQQAQQAGPAGRGTLLITNPGLLSAADLQAIAGSPADIVLTDPDPASLAALAPLVTATGVSQLPFPVQPGPGCTLQAATLAGSAVMGGTLLATTAPGAEQCYNVGGGPALIEYPSDGRTITVVGSSAPFVNQNLAQDGDAALALNLLGASPRLIWLVPDLNATAPVASGQTGFLSLVPRPAYLVALQLVIAAVLLALWRARRLGPLVPERLPAVVHAAETAEGHGRLYHARRSRGRAAEALREAATKRMLPALGLPPDATLDAVAAAATTRTGEPAQDVAQALHHTAPRNDTELVRLADRLDELERKAGTAP